MEKLKINTNAITVQNETKKHFITGSTLFVESLLIIFFFKDEISLCEKFKYQCFHNLFFGSVNRTVSRLCLHYPESKSTHIVLTEERALRFSTEHETNNGINRLIIIFAMY